MQTPIHSPFVFAVQIMIDFRVETFLCVCKHMNFTKAAEELGMTQPGVSQHIKFLETYYSIKLFDYLNKHLTLTPAGKELKSAMLSIRHDTIQLKNNIHNELHGKKVLNLGATLSIGEFILPNALIRYAKKYPDDICLHYKISNTQELLSELDAGIIDFAFVEGNFPKKNYDYIMMKQEKFIPVCGAEYPTQTIKSFSDLLNHTLIVREDGSGTKEVLISYLFEHGYHIDDFTNNFTMNSPHLIKQFLENNLGISFMYQSVVSKELLEEKLKEIELDDFNMSHEFNFIWRKNSIYSDSYKTFYHQLLN